MKKPSVGIIGAGPGGLACGMILAHKGFDVTVFEKEKEVGGRNAPIKLKGYTFDTGPTFLMMKFVLDNIFKMTGRKSSDYLKVKRLEPMYKLCFNDFEFNPTTDKKKMAKEMNRVFPGNAEGLKRFYVKEKKRYEMLAPCLEIDYSSFGKFFTPRFISALPYLYTGNSIFDNLGNYFKEDDLRLCFTFQSKYLGMSAWECPGAFTMIPYVEHAFGIYHVMGGLNQISKKMADVIKEDGGKVQLKKKVKRVIVEDGVAKGVVLSNGSKKYFDYVVVNADFAHAMTELFAPGELSKYSKKNLEKKKYSCSTFMLYLGVDKVYKSLPHHSIYFAKDYKTNVKEIFDTKKLSKDISFYVQNPSISDKSLAPKGKSTIYILVPVPNQKSKINWKKQKKKYRELVIKALEKRTPMKDIRKHIEVEKVITPDEWEKDYSVFYGATFNLAHNLTQMLYFRPHNRFEEVENMYIVGGGTHPGSGLPTIYESGRISAELILKNAR